VLELVQALLHLDQLVDLFLIGDHGEARAAVVHDVGHLLGARVLIERHGHRAHRLRRDHRPVEIGTVAADDGDEITLRHAEVQEPERDRLDLARGLGPGPALPDPEFLFAIGRLVADAGDVLCEKRRNGFRIRPVGDGLGHDASSLPGPPRPGGLLRAVGRRCSPSLSASCRNSCEL